MGELPEIKEGNKYIYVAVDSMTRWVIAGVKGEDTAETVCEFLFKKVVCSFGVPEVAVSDRGSNFMAEYTHAFFNRMGARWKHSTSQRPQSNGIVERMNRTLAGMY